MSKRLQVAPGIIKATLVVLTLWGSSLFAQVICDSTIVIDASSNSSGSPYDPSAFNTHLDSLDENTCVTRVADFTLDFQNLPTDTVFLSGTINLSPTDSILQTNFQVINSSKPNQIVFLATTSQTMQVLFVDAPDVNIQNTGFRTPLNAPAIFSNTGAKFLRVSSCEFLQYAATVIINMEDSVLIEKSYFHNHGSIFITAIDNSGSGVEIRSNLFMTTGINSSSHGIHILANTFVGTMSGEESINITDISSPTSEDFKIQHNLFAFDNPLLPPIRAEADGSPAPTDSIVRNAFVVGISNFINNATQQVALSDNVFLPTGLADYPNSDFPLVQMHTDLSLKSDDATFGHVPEVYRNFTSVIPSIQTQLFSPDFGIIYPGFTPHTGSSWNTTARVGCFSVFDPTQTVYRPSPIETITFAPNGYKISQTSLTFDAAHYGQDHTTQVEMFYFMSNSPTISANDTTSLANRDFFWDGVIYAENGQGINFPTSHNTVLDVPDSLRTGAPVYVKMVHKNANGFAVVNDAVAIQTVANVPEYPQTDFILRIRPNDEAQHQLGVIRLDFVQGVEVIDSIGIQAVRVGDESILVDTVLYELNLSLVVFTDLPERTTVKFRAFPIGNSGEIGKDTLETDSVALNQITSSFVYVTPRVSCLPYPAVDGLGTIDDPFCRIEHALNEAALRLTTIIVNVHPTEPTPITSVIIDETYGTHPLTIVSGAYRNLSLNERPVIRSMVVDRPNTTISGFVIENESPTVPAISLRNNNLNLDGNVLRFSNAASFTGELVNIEQTVPTDSVFIYNNMFFNGTPAVMLAGPGDVQIVNNSFYSTHSSTVGISRNVALLTGIHAVIANNYFSGDDVAYSQPFSPVLQPVISQLQTILFTLERNVFAMSYPDFFELDTLLKGVTQLEPARAVKIQTHAGDQATFLALFVKGRSEDVLHCAANDVCSPLSLGASPNYVSASDIFGNTRTGLRDVGAIEELNDSSWVSGHLALPPGRIFPESARVNFRSLNYDHIRQPILYIWWQAGTLTGTVPPRLAAKGEFLTAIGPIEQGGLQGLSMDLEIVDLGPVGSTWSVCQAFGTIAGENNHGSCIEFTTAVNSGMEPQKHDVSDFISFSIGDKKILNLKELDVAGRARIINLSGEILMELEFNRRNLTWHGLDKNGGPAANGIYFLKIEIPGGFRYYRFIKM